MDSPCTLRHLRAKLEASTIPTDEGEPMNKITRIGIDLAKHIFYLHGVNASGKTVLRKKLVRKDVLPFFAQLPACEVSMEACSGSHYWGRELQQLGHTVLLISPKFVVPYRKNQKNDYNDAEAICEAASRDHMRFVALKSEEQQALLMIHRMREQYVAERTSKVNQIRGHLNEFGVVVPITLSKLLAALPEILESNNVPSTVKINLRHLLDSIHFTNAQIDLLEKQLKEFAKNNEDVKRLMTIKGVGIISATAIVSTVGDAKLFSSSRQFAAWVGLVPKQFSSGGKIKLGGITKSGDQYLRKLFIQGARAVLFKCSQQEDLRSQWINRLRHRKPDNVVATALAAKIARTVWAVLVRGENYQEYTCLAAAG